MTQKKCIRYGLSSLGLSFLLLVNSGCAVLHHVQVGQVDDREEEALVPFEIMMSETGISTGEIGGIARATHTRGGDNVAFVAAVVSLFQMGPRTGNGVYSEHYAEKLIYKIYEKCPSGKITGLVSIREMRKYPVISGEIVKVTGYCRKTRVDAVDASKTESNDLNQGAI